MILRAALVGIVLWVLELAALRFLGASFFTPMLAPSPIGFAASAVGAALVGVVVLRLLKEAHGDEAEAALGVALPGLMLGAAGANFFGDWFPALDPALDGVFGAHMLTQAAGLTFVGLFSTGLAPKDERL